MSTGELVPHFAELDVRAADKPGEPGALHPPGRDAQARHALRGRDQEDAQGQGRRRAADPEGFQAILDGETTTHPLLEKRAPRYNEIFAALEAKGIHKTDLVVAWDFTTRSRASVQADLLQRARQPRSR